MVGTIDLTFLGTSSAQPSPTRNHQAMALRMDGDIWLFDCGEATQHQLQKSTLRMGRISHIFITHMHGDHCFGLAPLLCSISDHLNPEKSQKDSSCIEIYGPSPLRRWLRTTLISTYSQLGKSYRVHEILLDDNIAAEDENVTLHPNELRGQDLRITQGHIRIPTNHSFTVLAAPIQHSIPSLGFLIQEPDVLEKTGQETIDHIERNAEALKAQGMKNPKMLLGQLRRTMKPIPFPDGTLLHPPKTHHGREIIILGDTCDPSSMLDIAKAPTVLVHEATNALTSQDAALPNPPTHEEVTSRTISHGHSTPQMAASFAKRIAAKTLILTHFSSRYNGDESEESLRVMEEIRKQAVDVYGMDDRVYCARDLWSFEIKMPKI